MQAIVYRGYHEATIEEIDDPEIEHPNDVIISVTTTGISWSDLDVYEGRTNADPGTVLGNENLGVVEQVGDGVDTLEEGDRIVLPFNVACGFCRNCENGKTGFCTNVNPGFAGGAYGYVAMGPYKGGQAEKLRVPYADFNALKLPEGGSNEDSFALLADIFPTGWHGTRLADLQPGESVAIYGAGPVGLMAAYSAKIQGASEIYSVDRVPSRLDLARDHCDATPINFEEGNPIKQIKDINGGGVDKGVDAVGYQAIDPDKQADDAYDPARENPANVLNNLIRTVRPTGQLGIVGQYVPDDPGAPDEMAAQGRLGIDFGLLFKKGQKLGTGLCDVKRYNRKLRDMIIEGQADPSFIVSHRVRLSEAPEMYEILLSREHEALKVFLEPDVQLNTVPDITIAIPDMHVSTIRDNQEYFARMYALSVTGENESIFDDDQVQQQRPIDRDPRVDVEIARTLAKEGTLPEDLANRFAEEIIKLRMIEISSEIEKESIDILQAKEALKQMIMKQN